MMPPQISACWQSSCWSGLHLYLMSSPKPSHFAQIIPQWCLNKTKGLSVTSKSFLESSNFTPYVCYPLSTSTCIYVWWCFPPPLLHPSMLIKFWWCFSPSTFIRSLHVYYFGENFPASTFIRSLHVYWFGENLPPSTFITSSTFIIFWKFSSLHVYSTLHYYSAHKSSQK